MASIRPNPRYAAWSWTTEKFPSEGETHSSIQADRHDDPDDDAYPTAFRHPQRITARHPLRNKENPSKAVTRVEFCFTDEAVVTNVRSFELSDDVLHFDHWRDKIAELDRIKLTVTIKVSQIKAREL